MNVDSQAADRELRRLIGPGTALLVGMGIAIGSGIFRTPGIVAEALRSPFWIVGIWLFGGLFSLVAGLVNAELATRFPKAGGEYVYLREAYGQFVAFFFGWAFTIFLAGGGVATIGAAAGEAEAALLGLSPDFAGYLGAATVVVVTGVNVLGLSAGAAVQNVLTLAKVLALVGVVILAAMFGEATTEWTVVRTETSKPLIWALVAALPAVIFSYGGTTDTAKLAEEVEDPQRAIPRALIGAALAVTALYCVVNVAYLWVLTPDQIAGRPFVANDVLGAIFGARGAVIMTALSLLVFIGSLSSTILAVVRVTFALARDGLTFSFLAKMSDRQAPVGSLVLVGGIAVLFNLFRGFQEILNIYFLASGVLFGLSYLSLIVFRVRDRSSGLGFPESAFRCPAGPALALGLIAVQLAIAYDILRTSPMDSLYTAGLLLGVALLYLVWRQFRPLTTKR